MTTDNKKVQVYIAEKPCFTGRIGRSLKRSGLISLESEIAQAKKRTHFDKIEMRPYGNNFAYCFAALLCKGF